MTRVIIGFFPLFCLINGAVCLMILPFNIGNLLTFLLGLLVLLWLAFEKHLIEFFSGGSRRIIAYAAGVLAAVGLAGFFVFFAATMLHSVHTPAQGQDVIIVLGAGLMGDRISIPLAARLDKALQYYEENQNCLLVVSGGQGPSEKITEADAMATYLIACGVPADKILRERRAANTTENFVFTKELLDEYFGGRAYNTVFVTNRFHAFRSAYAAKKTGLDAQCLAAASKPFYFWPNYYFREYLAVIDYLFIKP
jgi:uncharacterized SAM-binding protein YcdF (DUF218 family)